MTLAITPDENEFYTPKYLFEDIIYPTLGRPIGCDPCGNPYHTNDHECIDIYRKFEEGGLGRAKWFSDPTAPTVFVNPPYGREIGDWIEKSIWEYERVQGNLEFRSPQPAMILLVPTKTGTRWWAELMDHTALWFGLTGRIKFDVPVFDSDGAFCGIGQSRNMGTFDSALVLLTESPYVKRRFGVSCLKSRHKGIIYGRYWDA